MPVQSLCIELAVKTVRITFALRTSLYSLTFVQIIYGWLFMPFSFRAYLCLFFMHFSRIIARALSSFPFFFSRRIGCAALYVCCWWILSTATTPSI